MTTASSNNLAIFRWDDTYIFGVQYYYYTQNQQGKGIIDLNGSDVKVMLPDADGPIKRILDQLVSMHVIVSIAGPITHFNLVQPDGSKTEFPVYELKVEQALKLLVGGLIQGGPYLGLGKK